MPRCFADNILLSMATEAFSELLVATGNSGKAREIASLLAPHGVTVRTLADLHEMDEVPEPGETFLENAELKARGYAAQTRMWSLADDSGLEVAALGNRPGIHSARYAGADSGYDVKIPRLLEELGDTRTSDRSARFVCAMAVADGTARILFSALGLCDGRIAKAPRGTNGFGYDPVFIPAGFDLTFGELPDDVKQRISHRARATREIIRYLLGFTGIPA